MQTTYSEEEGLKTTHDANSASVVSSSLSSTLPAQLSGSVLSLDSMDDDGSHTLLEYTPKKKLSSSRFTNNQEEDQEQEDSVFQPDGLINTNLNDSVSLQIDEIKQDQKPNEISSSFLLRYFEFSSWSAAKTELKVQLPELLRIAFPIVITYTVYLLIASEDLAFVGRLGSEYLAATAMAISYFDIFAYVAFGISGGLQTLGSQAFGAQNYEMLGLLLQRGLILGTILCIPLSIIYYLSEYFFLLIGKDPFFAATAGLYIRIVIPALWASTYFRIISEFLVMQHVTVPPLICTIVSLIANIVLNYVFIFGSFAMGFAGAAVATVLTRTLQLVLLLIYLKFAKLPFPTWTSFRLKEVIMDYKSMLQYLKYAAPSSLLLCLEVWAFALCTFISTFLDDKQSSAYVISMNLSGLAFMVALGLAAGGNVLVGNKIGEGKPGLAKFCGIIAISLSIFWMLFSFCVSMIWRNYIGYVFTSDVEVITILGSIIIINSSFGIADGIQGVCIGIMRALGKQMLASIFNFVAYYIIGLPLALLFAFYLELNAAGLWIGMAISLWVVGAALLCFVIFFINWKKECEKAQKEVGKKTEIALEQSQLELQQQVEQQQLETAVEIEQTVQ